MDRYGLTIHELAEALSVSARTVRRRVRERQKETGDTLTGTFELRGHKVAWLFKPLSRNPEYRFFLDAEEPPDPADYEAPHSTIDDVLDRLGELEEQVAELRRHVFDGERAPIGRRSLE